MFKSDRFRKFLFATDQDKKKGNINPLQPGIQLASISATHPSMSSNISMNSKFPNHGTIHPTSIPSLPALPKMPKFGKVKKYLKKNF